MKFYETENTRHYDLHEWPLSEHWAQKAVKALSKTFHIKVRVRFIDGRISYGGPGLIRLGRDAADWLTLCHEFAHVLQYKLRMPVRHDRRMATLVDVLTYYVRAMGWPVEDLKRIAPPVAP